MHIVSTPSDTCEQTLVTSPRYTQQQALCLTHIWPFQQISVNDRCSCYHHSLKSIEDTSVTMRQSFCLLTDLQNDISQHLGLLGVARTLLWPEMYGEVTGSWSLEFPLLGGPPAAILRRRAEWKARRTLGLASMDKLPLYPHCTSGLSFFPQVKEK